MCAIGGFLAKKENSRFAQEKFTQLLMAGEVRGTDACGIAFNTGKGSHYFCKSPQPASEFINEKLFKEAIKNYNPTLLIGHNRAKTQGDEKNNNNNHPVVTKTGLSLIHNGIITNDIELIKDYKLKLDGQVDSEVIVRMIEHYIYTKKFDTIKAIRLTAQKIRGSMAFALLNAKEPETVYLVASTNPINFAYHKPTGTIFFASTEDILKIGLLEYDYFFKGLFKGGSNESDYLFSEMADDTGIKLTIRNWESFEIKRPEFQTWGGGNSRGTFTDDDGYPVSHYLTTGSRTAGSKPIIVEARGEADIIKALKDRPRFDQTQTIKRPKDYFSEELIMRLEYIQDMLASGELEDLLVDDNDDELVLRSEIRRIINCLDQRKRKTNREIYIPTFSEIITYRNCSAEDFISIKWVLADKNTKLMDLMTKAQEAKEDEEREKTLDSIADTQPTLPIHVD